jgi:ATP synthase I chain
VDDRKHAAIERRIEAFIAVLGVAIVAAAGALRGFRAAEGAAAGALLCWLNFRWLRQGAATVTGLGLAQAGAETVKVPKRVHAKFFGRLVLLILAVYVILAWIRLPATPVVCGLVVVVPAVMLELGYELTQGHHRLNAE